MIILFVLFSSFTFCAGLFVCPKPNGLFADSSSIDMFYHCVNNFPYRKPCPSGSLWSPTRQRCIPKPVIVDPLPTDRCSKEKPCLNGGFCESSSDDDFFCLCRENFSGTHCEQFVETIELTSPDALFDEIHENQDHFLETILNRTYSTNTALVVDVTGSMNDYIAALYKWIRNSHKRTQYIRYFVFFNDGDGKLNREKTVGNTGGIYAVPGNNVNQVLANLQTAVGRGQGGDLPENDLEAILQAIEKCSSCQSIVHMADNQVTPRDMNLVVKVTKPIHVVPCNVKNSPINLGLLSIVEKSDGSLQTIDEEVRHISTVPIGTDLTIGSHRYRRTNNGFLVV